MSGLLFAVFVVLVLASVVVRFRRAQGEERQQLKWLVYGVLLLVLLVPTLGRVLEQIPSPFAGPVFAAVMFSIIPVTIGLAVLKYRLYDIDRVISRTLAYALLTALLAAVYTIVVLVLGQVFGGITEQPPSWAVAGATLAVASLFQPAPPPHPGRGGSPLQPAPVRRSQDCGGLQRPPPQPGRPGHTVG